MRTKHFLTALCLPLAFAACTNDDFVNESNTLEGRGMIDVTLTAARSSYGADTKMSIDDKNQFVWEKDADMIGAALVDGAAAGIVANDIYVNYPFTADADGNVSTFSGKSAMTQGLYFFYYEYQDVLNRRALPMGSPNQVYDAASKKTALQQAAQYMRMVSPIVNLAGGLKYEDAQAYNLNLKFDNLYTVVQVNIKSANIPEGTAPKVTKIKLDGKKGNASAFKLNAAVDMTKVKKAGVITLNKGQIKTDEQTAALAKLEEIIASGEIYSTKQLQSAPLKDARGNVIQEEGAPKYKDVESGEFELNVKGDVVLDAAKVTSLYILVPKGTYDRLDLTVETSEGSYTREVKPADGSIELANKTQPISADLNFAQDGTGNVILPDKFDIASAEDWTSAIKFMTDHAVGYLNKQAKFRLTKDVTIESLPIFSLTITADKAKTLTLSKDYTISADNKDQFTFENVNLAVASGATMTLKAQPKTSTIKNEEDQDVEFVPTFINYGTLNVSADLKNSIANFGTLNVTTNAAISGGLTNGRLEDRSTNPVTPERAGTVNVTKGKTLTVNTEGLENVNGTVAVAEEAILHINNVASTNEVDGKIEVKVNGILKATTLALTNMGVIDNFGSLKADIDNYKTYNKGKENEYTVNGMFIIEKGSSAAGKVEPDCVIINGGTVEVKDAAAFSTAQGNSGNPLTKYAFGDGTGTSVAPTITTKVANAKEYMAADAAGVTDITLAGGEWTLIETSNSYQAGTDKVVVAPANATGLALEGATLNVNVANLSKNIATSGKATSTVKAVTNAVTIEGNVTVGAGSTLVVENKVTVNSTDVNSEAATINGTLNVMPGVKMYFNTATVAKNANLNVKGNTNEAEAGVFGVKVTAEFSNNGVVTSEAGTKTTGDKVKVEGKVSQPTNGATGTFKGNAATDIF